MHAKHHCPDGGGGGVACLLRIYFNIIKKAKPPSLHYYLFVTCGKGSRHTAHRNDADMPFLSKAHDLLRKVQSAQGCARVRER